jgi:predicted nucleic acid-binding Zn ribbon protein
VSPAPRCQACGEQFPPGTRSDKKYCNWKCREMARNSLPPHDVVPTAPPADVVHQVDDKPHVSVRQLAKSDVQRVPVEDINGAKPGANSTSSSTGEDAGSAPTEKDYQRKTPPTVACLGCGQMIHNGWGNRRWCSNRCKVEYKKIHNTVLPARVEQSQGDGVA